MRQESDVEQTIGQYADMVKHICFVYMKNESDTEDVFQDVFLKYALFSEPFDSESEAIRARHAVRNYTTKPLSPAVIDGLKEEIEQCNRLGQLHIQLVTENDEAFKSIIPLFGRFKCKNYIALAAKKQGGFYVECGYYGARLMVKAQQAGLNSCWVAMQ